jgi:type I restriction enzyme S subunit
VPLARCVDLSVDKPREASGDHLYVGLEHVESWTGRLLDTVADSESDECGVAFARGDVLFGKLRPYLAKAHAAQESGRCSAELLVLRPRRLLPRYLLYCLLSPAWISLVDSSTYGSKMPRANWEFIGRQLVPVPPTDRQAAIADFLDHETEKIDALVLRKQRLLQLLQEKRAALTSHAVSSGLYGSTPMRDSGSDWLGRIPAPWEVQPLGRYLRRITYGFTNPMPTEDEGPYMLTANDIGDGEILWAQARRTSTEAFARDLTDKSRPRAGDVLVTKDGTLGRVAVHDGRPACVNQSVAVLRPYGTLRPGFLSAMLRAEPYKSRVVFDAGGTTIRHIYITRLAKMLCAVPPLAEQDDLLAHIARIDAESTALVGVVGRAIDALHEYRSALITAAVTGQIDVCHYRGDPEGVLEAS